MGGAKKRFSACLTCRRRRAISMPWPERKRGRIYRVMKQICCTRLHVNTSIDCMASLSYVTTLFSAFADHVSTQSAFWMVDMPCLFYHRIYVVLPLSNLQSNSEENGLEICLCTIFYSHCNGWAIFSSNSCRSLRVIHWPDLIWRQLWCAACLSGDHSAPPGTVERLGDISVLIPVIKCIRRTL